MEPFLFILTFLCNKVRNTAKDQRVLALPPSAVSINKTKKRTFGVSFRNYHIALRSALKDCVELPQNSPIVHLRLNSSLRELVSVG